MMELPPSGQPHPLALGVVVETVDVVLPLKVTGEYKHVTKCIQLQNQCIMFQPF